MLVECSAGSRAEHAGGAGGEHQVLSWAQLLDTLCLCALQIPSVPSVASQVRAVAGSSFQEQPQAVTQTINNGINGCQLRNGSGAFVTKGNSPEHCSGPSVSKAQPGSAGRRRSCVCFVGTELNRAQAVSVGQQQPPHCSSSERIKTKPLP